MTFEELQQIIAQRKGMSADESYTARLVQAGVDRVAQKVGEEGVEVVIASKNDDKQLLVGEMADLIYHLLVLMSLKGVSITDIEAELGKRHAEKS